eukprot:COSAG06_NODE_32617_length_503_cov_0.789604_1_plen_100_part_00
MNFWHKDTIRKKLVPKQTQLSMARLVELSSTRRHGGWTPIIVAGRIHGRGVIELAELAGCWLLYTCALRLAPCKFLYSCISHICIQYSTSTAVQILGIL